MSKTPNDHGEPGKRFVDLHPISKVSLSQIVGLVEAVDEQGGDADVALIARESEMDLDVIAPVVAAAELLGLVTVDAGNLRLTDLSRRILEASVRERKSIFREIVQAVPVFRQVMDRIRDAGRPLSRDEVLGALSAHIGSHQSEEAFRALVYWGRYAELVTYDSRSERLGLRTPGA